MNAMPSGMIMPAVSPQASRATPSAVSDPLKPQAAVAIADKAQSKATSAYFGKRSPSGMPRSWVRPCASA